MKYIAINLVFDEIKNNVTEMEIIENTSRTEFLTTDEEPIKISKAIELIRTELNELDYASINSR